MTWMHCLNCGWQGENNAGKSEKVTGGLMLAAGVGILVAQQRVPVPLWLGIVLLIVGVVTILMGVGATASMACPHCQSTDIKRYKPNLDDHGAGKPPHPGG